jgi:hypothetical protein
MSSSSSFCPIVINIAIRFYTRALNIIRALVVSYPMGGGAYQRESKYRKFKHSNAHTRSATTHPRMASLLLDATWLQHMGACFYYYGGRFAVEFMAARRFAGPLQKVTVRAAPAKGGHNATAKGDRASPSKGDRNATPQIATARRQQGDSKRRLQKVTARRQQGNSKRRQQKATAKGDRKATARRLQKATARRPRSAGGACLTNGWTEQQFCSILRMFTTPLTTSAHVSNSAFKIWSS